MALIFPAIPPEPGAGALPAEWDVYLRAVAINNNALDTQAKQAMADAQNATAEAVNGSVAAFGKMPKPSKSDLILSWIGREPMTVDDTVTTVLARVTKQVDAFIKANPGAVRE